ncbi:MAG: serine/threonine protein kinase [Myxococcales bacterium]|nr:serine/threonine protein kinase [Myxococcales bacterium]
MSLAPGTLFDGRFAIERLLGQGGMGAVYAARHQALDRAVAIKVIHASLDSNPQMRSRFRREARSLSRVAHPYVPSVYDYGEDAEGQPFLVMELVQGQTLRQLLPSGGLPLARALNILAQTAAALRAIHRCAIVHRDLKPANVLVTPHDGLGDQVKVTDFGLAKLVGLEQSYNTEHGGAFGSPPYMAPEQFDTTRAVDPRTDIYAFGAMAFHVIAGRPPFESPTLVGLARAHIYDPAPSLAASSEGIPAVVDQIVARCLAKDPAARYASATALLEALREAASRHAPSKQTSLATTLDTSALAASGTASMQHDNDAAAAATGSESSVQIHAALVRALRERGLGDARLLRGLAALAQSRDAVDQAELELAQQQQALAQFEQQQRARRTALQSALFELEREAHTGGAKAVHVLDEPLEQLRHHFEQLGRVKTRRLAEGRQHIADWREELERRRAGHDAQREAMKALLAPLAATATDPELLALFAQVGV